MRKLFLIGLVSLCGMNAPAVFAEQLQTITLEVDNMTCAVCPITVKKALQDVAGVKSAKAELATHTAQVTFDVEQVKVDALVDAVTFAGYPARPKN